MTCGLYAPRQGLQELFGAKRAIVGRSLTSLIVTRVPRTPGRAISATYTDTHGPLLPTASPATKRPSSRIAVELANVMTTDPAKNSAAVAKFAALRPILEQETRINRVVHPKHGVLQYAPVGHEPATKGSYDSADHVSAHDSLGVGG